MKKLDLPKERQFIGPALVWKRIAAFLIDMMILNLVVLFPFRRLFQGMLPKEYSFSEAYKSFAGTMSASYISWISFAMSVLAILYFFMLERKMSQTIGKRLMRIYVAGDAGKLKAWQLLARNIVFMPIFPFILLWILDPLFMVFSKTNQRLSEILSKTRVVGKYSLD